ncbi:selenium cofactor biosynthesis protein YqeC [Thermodesulfobacteriota bacterium]
MEKSTGRLTEALALGEREHIAFVGGGGKTTLMLALASELSMNRKTVVCSTTTKVRHREIEDLPCVLFKQSDPDWKIRLHEGLEASGLIFLGEKLLEAGKAEGIQPGLADKLYKDEGFDYLLVEADGAAGRPLKAPADFEPVIPESVTRVVALVGLEALGQNAGEGIVFRVDLFQQLTGIKPGQKLTPAGIIKLIEHPNGLYKFSPSSAKKVAFLNKLDLLEDTMPAKELAELMLGDQKLGIERVVIGSLIHGVYDIEGEQR